MVFHRMPTSSSLFVLNLPNLQGQTEEHLLPEAFPRAPRPWGLSSLNLHLPGLTTVVITTPCTTLAVSTSTAFAWRLHECHQALGSLGSPSTTMGCECYSSLLFREDTKAQKS